MRLSALADGRTDRPRSAPPLTACSDDKEPVSNGKTADEVMELAKTTIDDTSGLTISLTTDDLPDGVTGIVAAEGVGTHAPAFEGTITVRLLGNSVEVPVIAVDGEVFAVAAAHQRLPDHRPRRVRRTRPRPADEPDEGFSSLLPATTDLEDG